MVFVLIRHRFNLTKPGLASIQIWIIQHALDGCHSRSRVTKVTRRASHLGRGWKVTAANHVIRLADHFEVADSLCKYLCHS